MNLLDKYLAALCIITKQNPEIIIKKIADVVDDDFLNNL